MARNDGIDRTFARNQDLPTLDDVAKVQEHNEREKESYSNQDIDTTQTYRKRWENRMNPVTGTVERKIGNTWYLLETVCDGNEPLTHKVKRLIFSDKEALCS